MKDRIKKNVSRRSLLSAIGAALPMGLAGTSAAASGPAPDAPAIRLRLFEDAVLEAFKGLDPITHDGVCRRVEVGDSDRVRAGLQGYHNARPFAGHRVGCLRIVRSISGPGPARGGVRLHVAAVDIVMTAGPDPEYPSRPLDFALLPAAPSFA